MSTSGLIVRRTERFEISLPGKVRVAMQHLDAVQFVKGVTGEDRWFDVDVVDFSEGGVGFVSDIFFARALELELMIPDTSGLSDQPMLLCEMQVKRVQMTDRRPAYLVGCAFGELLENQREDVERLISKLLGQSEGEGGEDHA